MNFSRERALVLAAATVSFGFASILRKLAVDRMPPLKFQVASSLVYAASIPMFMVMANRYEKNETVEPWANFWMLLATVVSVFGNILFGYALRGDSDVGVTTALASASPVITLMLAFLFFGEVPTLQAAIGCALVVLGVMVISLR